MDGEFFCIIFIMNLLFIIEIYVDDIKLDVQYGVN
jgi:hypothetical protein